MPNQNIFCNTPWYEIHIYQDGGFGICCQEDHKLYSKKDSAKYNIARMSIMNWFNSPPAKKFRLGMMGKRKLSACRQCYIEEEHGANSRRHRSNQKSVIFTRTAFDESFRQSPGYDKFLATEENKGSTSTYPIDLHIDLGNYCNLACKMCTASASSTIAAQEVKWGNEDAKQFVGTDWTRDDKVWTDFKEQILKIPRLNNLHFMGGETLLTDRLDDLIDTLIEHRRFDLCLSFVTNGTVFKEDLMEKLKQFRRVGLEISIETTTLHNAYQRQGTPTHTVINNIRKYISHSNGTSITVALRPAPSTLSIGNHVSLLEFCIENRLLLKSNLVYTPRFLDITILPDAVKQRYRQQYVEFLSKFDINTDGDYNASDPNNYQQVVVQHAKMCLALLDTPAPDDQAEQLEAMVRHCERWDRIYNLNAWALYPEWESILHEYRYDISK